MQPVSQGVSALDLQKIRQQNDDSLQARATQQMGGELKAGTVGGVSKEEKLTAGQGDQVDLSPKDKGSRTTKAASPDSASATASTTAAPAGDSVEPKAPAAAAGGDCFLNINSRPASTVLLDGKPLGPTPRVKVPVSAGTHTVLFVNAEESLKKSVTVTVAAGETKAVSAKLRD